MIFKGLSIHIARLHRQSRTGGGGGLIRETKVPVQELWLKMGGGLFARGGVFAGHYSTSFVVLLLAVKCIQAQPRAAS